MALQFDFAHKGDFEMKVTTFFGLEELLAKELAKLGGKQVTEFKRGVSVVGDLGFLYKVNLSSYLALKVLIPIARFNAGNDAQLYDNIHALPWEKFISESDSLMVEAVLNSDSFSHSLFVSQKVKDAIVDRFRNQSGKRPDVDLIHPVLRVYVHIFKNEVSVHLDSSGDPLYKRGYRTDVGEASLKEVLAAGLVKLSGWEKHRLLIDGMCGAATIGIEAAFIANNIPPGYFRNQYGFMRWRNFDENLYNTIYESSISRISNDKVNIQANDIDPEMVKKAQRNIRSAKVEDAVTCRHESFFDLKPERNGGVIILNPPYGERLAVKDIESLYREIGNKLKKDFNGFNAWIITSSPEAIKSVGLRPSRKIQIYNGSLECRYLKYELYEGSKKQTKQQPGTS